MALATQAVLDDANCLGCNSNADLAQMLTLGLLKQIAVATNPALDTSVQALFDEVACANCLSNASTAELLEIALLAKIAGL